MVIDAGRRAAVCLAATAVATGLCALLSPAGPAIADQSWPTRVSAHYKVVVAGFELGKFQFTSSLNGSEYALSGQAHLTWGFGMFHWTSTTRSSGSVAGDHVVPAGYTLDYKINSQSGSVNLAFQNDAVTRIDIQPGDPPAAGTVPLKDHHMKAVFDPMSALMALSRGSAANPCGRRIALFEGRQRFELALSFRRQEKVVEAKPSGQPAIAYVCRVQYIPVAGHKLNKATQDMASNAGIEVALRPVPSANLLVPTRITIPTALGNAEIVLSRVDIVAPGNRQIALNGSGQ